MFAILALLGAFCIFVGFILFVVGGFRVSVLWGLIVLFLPSVLSFAAGWVPPTLNYEHADPACAIPVIAGAGLSGSAPMALLVNQSVSGQGVALVIAAP